ncbi:MAG: polysaccharide pyruvyl transferase family protein, partial [Oscillospiraceae bacterium]
MIKKIIKKFATKNECTALLGDNIAYYYFTNHFIKNGRKNMIEYLPDEIIHPAVFLISTPTYQNIGDHALSIAELQFLEKHWNGLVYEITLDQLRDDYKKLHTLVNESDIICIQAGGNMGTEYLEAEVIRRKVIADFPENKIVSFPQTIFYGEKAISRILLMRSKKSYNKHKSLYLFAREEKSYNLMKQIYSKANVLFAPDIVLQAKFESNAETVRQESVLLCLRGDCESVVGENKKNEISNFITQLGYGVNTTDMASPVAVCQDKREVTIVN